MDGDGGVDGYAIVAVARVVVVTCGVDIAIYTDIAIDVLLFLLLLYMLWFVFMLMLLLLLLL